MYSGLRPDEGERLKIAIAAVLFDDQQRIGSHRARSLARELAANGHEVTVFTAGDPQDHSSPFDGVNVVRLGGEYGPDLWRSRWAARILRKPFIAVAIIGTTPRVSILKLKRRTGRITATETEHYFELNRRRRATIRRIDLLLSTNVWIKKAQTALRQRAKTEMMRQDVAFSTFDPLGRLLRDEGLARLWVNDFRDPVVSQSFLGTLNRYLRAYQTLLLRDADAVTTVSQGVKRTLTSPRKARALGDKITVIPNGYTQRSFRLIPTINTERPRRLRIGYTGKISERQLPEMARFLRALHDVNEAVGADAAELHYVGPDSARVAELANTTGTTDSTHLREMVPREEALEVQEQMDALLVLSYNDPGAEGILSGKFLEYLGADKPIIAVIGGTLPGSELAEIISRCRVGFSSERAQGEQADSLLTETLIEWARARVIGADIDFRPDRENVEAFDYRNLARRLEDLFVTLHDGEE